jgi:Mor family transcriptional regulator
MSSKVIRIPKEHWPELHELPGDLAFIARELEEHLPGQGLELTLIIAQIFRGQPLYIRSIDDLLRGLRNDAIRQEYDGGETVKKLAQKYQLSTRQIETILSSPASQEELKSKQGRLF